MKTVCFGLAVSLALFGCSRYGAAQVVFPASDLPHNIGESYEEYVGTNAPGLGLLVGTTNGPQTWDFSQPQQPYDDPTIVEVITPDDPSDFPNATYEEQGTDQVTGQQSLYYYQLDPSQGRIYYGFGIVPLGFPVTTTIVFSNQTVDVPASISFNQNWSRTVDYNFLDYNSFEYYEVHFIDQSAVDAYGNIKLPELGSLPALRVHEVHTEIISEYDFNTGAWNYFGSLTNLNYFWLVPGLGVAAQITFYGPDPTGPILFTNSFYRVYASSQFPPLYPVSELKAYQSGDAINLTWQLQSNAAAYQVQFVPAARSTNWLVLASPATNFYAEPLTSTQRFYRVFWEP
jgi:hypothetical protein